MRLWAVLLLVLLPAEAASAQEFKCNLAWVTWRDATAFFKARHENRDFNNPQTMLTPAVAIGCVAVKNDTAVVIYGFTDGQPDDFLVIPAAWMLKITPLTEAKGEPDEPRRGGELEGDSRTGLLASSAVHLSGLPDLQGHNPPARYVPIPRNQAWNSLVAELRAGGNNLDALYLFLKTHEEDPAPNILDVSALLALDSAVAHLEKSISLAKKLRGYLTEVK